MSSSAAGTDVCCSGMRCVCVLVCVDACACDCCVLLVMEERGVDSSNINIRVMASHNAPRCVLLCIACCVLLCIAVLLCIVVFHTLRCFIVFCLLWCNDRIVPHLVTCCQCISSTASLVTQPATLTCRDFHGGCPFVHRTEWVLYGE